jgi:hypothetical protein
MSFGALDIMTTQGRRALPHSSYRSEKVYLGKQPLLGLSAWHSWNKLYQFAFHKNDFALDKLSNLLRNGAQ